MHRSWNFLLGRQGSGRRHGQALACISTESYIESVVVAFEGMTVGNEVAITAERAKFDAQGQEIGRDAVGEFATIAYTFTLGDQEWRIEREPSFEGERSAEDMADALGLLTDRSFCESMVQAKCLLDRIGGQLRVVGHMHEGQLAGVVCHYYHVPKGQDDHEAESPALRLAEPEPGTPEAEHEAIERELDGAAA